EDIGKFPDTNLAESLQRITGISIDRRNGEGALVTARGFGPQYNMVTLNGRQMPGADAFGAGSGAEETGGVGSNTRAFNFANLSADAISAVEVYKTGRADVATGGIGATVNVRTARPFDNDGMVFNVGAKAVDDTTNRVGDDITPEVSGIFSFANADKTFGVGLNASYQKRSSGSEQATVNNWNIQAWDANAAENRRLAPLASNAVVENEPAVGQLYGIPNDIRYAFSDTERERINAQGVVQFAPIDSLTLTADYTFAQNEIKMDRGEQTVWMQRNGFTHVVFDTNEEVATPVLLEEFTGAGKDYGFEQQHNEQQDSLNSAGFNADWKVTDRFSLVFDFHDSEAKSSPNDPITGGSTTAFSLAGKVPTAGDCATSCTGYWVQSFQFNDGLPVAQRTLYPTNVDALAGRNGNADFNFDEKTLGSQVMRIAYNEQTMEIKQGRLDGALQFDNGRVQFGVESRDMQMHQRTSGGYMALGDWGVSDLGTVPQMVDLLQPFSLTGAFDDFSAAGAPTGGWKGNADTLGAWGVETYGNWSEEAATDGEFRYNPGFNNNNIVGEKTKSFYFQVALQGELGHMPTNLLLGAKYEQTDVTSTAHILPVTHLLWQDDNDFQVSRAGALSDVITQTRDADYNNLLPSLDFDVGLTDTLKSRFSYSKTIARANYGNLTTGATPGGPGGSTLNNFMATAFDNNPALLPLESDNIDLSVEWYFSDNGYASAGFFEKRVSNFIGNAIFNETVVGIGNENIKDQTGGPRAQAAWSALTAGGWNTDDSALFTMMAMIEHPEGATDTKGTTTTADDVFYAGGAAAYNGTNAQHIAFATAYDLIPRADDPDYVFAVQRPINNREAKIHGWEFGGQYFFADTGFGVLANYTVVRGDVGYNNASDPNANQFALLGLSDSANAVLMFEKFGFSARLAYNWRDEYLSNVNFKSFRNPIYVEAYSQLDLSVGYDLNDHLSLSFEGINLTGEDVRWHGRSEKQLWRLEDQGARYALGARYKF
ncbi:MAG: TonB-dependent receptor, partial [Povalibacter sp.]